VSLVRPEANRFRRLWQSCQGLALRWEWMQVMDLVLHRKEVVLICTWRVNSIHIFHNAKHSWFPGGPKRLNWKVTLTGCGTLLGHLRWARAEPSLPAALKMQESLFGNYFFYSFASSVFFLLSVYLIRYYVLKVCRWRLAAVLHWYLKFLVKFQICCFCFSVNVEHLQELNRNV